MANRIALITNGRLSEEIAAGAITPGHMIQMSAGADTVVVHATEAGYAERMFALEDALQGRNRDTAYASGERVTMIHAVPGDVLDLYIKAGENIAIGDKLISAGDGTLIENGSESSGTTVKQIIGVATEAADLSQSGDVATRIAVRIV